MKRVHGYLIIRVLQPVCNGLQVNRPCPFPSLICNKQDGPVLCMIIGSNLKSSLYCSDFFTVEVACGCLHLVVVVFFSKELIHAFILFLGRWCLLCFLNTTNLSTRCKMEQPMEPAAWKYSRHVCVCRVRRAGWSSGAWSFIGHRWVNKHGIGLRVTRLSLGLRTHVRDMDEWICVECTLVVKHQEMGAS